NQNKISFYALLSCIGGFTDASSFILLKTFTGHLTGNSILSLIYLTTFNWSMLNTTLVSILGFLLGTIFGYKFRLKNEDQKSQTYILLFILCIITLVFSIYFLFNEVDNNYMLIIAISLSMGIQNGNFSNFNNTGIHTTYITGMSTNLIGALLKSPQCNNEKKTYLCLIASFILGGVLGSILSINFGYVGFSFVIVIIITAILFSFHLQKNHN
ncbi:TPA: DUF1275 domain-containing protein, partial [Morganella morganii]|nr:DUF1275 domain-containing protein [Morganella morganii]